MSGGKATGRGWAYTGAILGGAVSVAANVAHSYVPPAGAQRWSPHLGAVIGAVFWPVALFVAVEIFARTPWGRQAKWAALRWLGLLPVALVAAVVSYRHLSGLLAFYREDALTATIGPLAVDGLMVMATAALVATGIGRSAPVAEPAPAPAVTVTPAEPAITAPSAPVAAVKPARPQVVRRPVSAEKVSRAAARMPGATVAEIAAKAGVSESTARRHLPAPTAPDRDVTVASASPLSPAQTPVLVTAV